jgi:hypothetical protein
VMLDKNNLQIADLILRWMHDNIGTEEQQDNDE